MTRVQRERGFDYRAGVAVVTGVSSGIGRAVALDLASRGTTVVGWARRAELLEEVADECRRGAPGSVGRVVDVAERGAVEAAVAEVLERFGRIDVLVNNAGIPMRVHASRVSVEDVERAMAVNFFGPVYATLAVLPAMLERGAGHVVNVSSVAGRVASPREAAYTASKHALCGWTDVLAADLASSGVGFHVVNPGPIRTEIWDKLAEPAAYGGRFYPPERVADAVRACVEGRAYERWVPRFMRLVPVARALAPRFFTRAAGRFDADRADAPGA